LLLSHYNGQFEFRKFENLAAQLLGDLNEETKDFCGFKYFKMNLFDERTTMKSSNGLSASVALIQYTLEV